MFSSMSEGEPLSDARPRALSSFQLGCDSFLGYRHLVTNYLYPVALITSPWSVVLTYMDLRAVDRICMDAQDIRGACVTSNGAAQV